MAFCPGCGTRRAEQRAGDSVQACPGCATRGITSALQRVRLGDVTVDECRSCAGLWVDRSTMHRLEADRAARASLGDEPGRRTPLNARAVTATTAPLRYRRCPHCATPMTRTNMARISGIIVDRCGAHGDYFDAEELRRLVSFWDEGGLDRLRRHEREVLAGERRTLALLQSIDAKRDRWAGRVADDASPSIAHWVVQRILEA